MSEDEGVERALRVALQEAAEQIEVRVPGPGDQPERASHGGRIYSRRAPVVAAAALAAAAVTVAVSLLTGRTDETTVATDAAPARLVEPAEVSWEEADLVVVMTTDATGDQVAAVREVIASSPDVARFAEVTREQALEELEDLGATVCGDSDGTDDDTATEELGARATEMLVSDDGGIHPSFRVVTHEGDEEAAARLRDSVAPLPGVISVEAGLGTGAPVPAEDGATPGVGGACSSVVGEDSQPDPGREGEAPAASVPVPPTTAPTLPPSSGDEPADPETARAAIAEAYTTAFDGSLTVGERRAHIEDSDELAPFMDTSTAPYPDILERQTVTLGDIVFLDAERAALVYTLDYGGRSAPQTDVGYAVLDDGRWKVSRETVCTLMMRGGVTCPPPAP